MVSHEPNTIYTSLNYLRSNITAIILNYYKSDLTIRCIESLAGQLDSVLIVENSNDINEYDTLHAKLILHSPKKRPKITLLKPSHNLGFARGVNYATTYLINNNCKCHILLLNNDCTIPSGTIRQLATTLDRFKGRALIAPDKTTNDEPFILWYQRLTGILCYKKIPFSFQYITGACILIPWELVSKRLFDQDFFMYGEDVELSWRMLQKQIPLITVPGVSIYHTGSASAPHGGLFYECNVARGHILLANKLANNSFESYMFYLGHFVTLTIRAILRSIRQHSLIPIIALYRALYNKMPPAPLPKT